MGLYAAWLLGRQPCLGVADNLDYFRVTHPAGIETPGPVPKQPGRYVNCTYEVEQARLSEMFSSAAMVAWLAKFVPFPSPPGTMALQQMGLLFLLLWLGLLLLFLRSGLPGGIAAWSFLVLLDPGYLLFWNSFYADAAVIFALCATVLWFSWSSATTRARRSQVIGPGWLLLLCLIAFLGSWSKMQHVLLAAEIAAVLAAFGLSRGIGRTRVAVTSAVLVSVSVLAMSHFFVGGGPRFLWANDYNAVYDGIVLVVDDPEQVLTELGVPAEYRHLPRRDVFSARIGPRHPVHASLAGLSRWQLLRLYAARPEALARVSSRVAREMAQVQTHTRGNHPWAPDLRRKRVYDPAWRFGRIRAFLLAGAPWMLWPFLGAVTTATVWTLFAGAQRASQAVVVLLLLLWFFSQVVIVVLGDGFAAFEQHLLTARLALDLILALAVYDLARLLLRRLAPSQTASTERAERELQTSKRATTGAWSLVPISR